MTLMRSASCVVLAAALFVGCEREETTGGTAGTAGTAGTGTSSVAETTTTPDTTTAAGTTATPDGASTAAPAAGTSAGAGAADAAASAAAAAPADPAAAPATQPAAATAAQAQTLLDQTITYIKENKLDLAEKGLTQLEQLKPKLPAEYHSKIDAARKAFNAAKTGQGLKLDGLLPGGSGAK